jgi:hypothetical protein
MGDENRLEGVDYRGRRPYKKKPRSAPWLAYPGTHRRWVSG